MTEKEINEYAIDFTCRFIPEQIYKDLEIKSEIDRIRVIEKIIQHLSNNLDNYLYEVITKYKHELIELARLKEKYEKK